MLFNSINYVIFFPIVLVLYLLLPKKAKPVWLLLCSYFFYMCWNPKYVVLILFTTLATYVCGLLIGKAEKVPAKKAWVGVCVGVNLAILFLFKYFDFFLDNLNRITSLFGGAEVKSPFEFLLPVGISFYTFQAIGYVIDVYRGDIKAEKNIIDYALFVSFFPQLVAGPIERSKNLLPQIKSIKEKNLFTYENLVSGFGTILWGLFMKMVIADRALIVVDQVFARYYQYGTVELVLGAILFSVQIYADFAGYSLIAIGSARIMGIRLMENFNTPYFSLSIADFWSKWHISLSTWFKDYVYIPLGGNRKGKIRKYFNLFITFLVSGLWHGAAWHYVVWGVLHGFYRVFGEITGKAREKITDKLGVSKSPFSFRFGKAFITCILVGIAWVFFRAPSIGVAFAYLKRMFTRPDFWVLSDESLYNLGLDRREAAILFIALLALVAVSVIRHVKKEEIGVFLARQNLWFRWVIFLVLIACILLFGEYGTDFSSAKFIYFDF
jgi:D-alanyl-lipoteichoic acid acyltransferase DltB (MBOAT superfamily)